MRLLNKDTKVINKIYISGIVTCLFSEVTSQECIVDSSATHHIAASKDVLSKDYKVIRSAKDKVNLPTEAKANVSCTGKAIVFRMKF